MLRYKCYCLSGKMMTWYIEATVVSLLLSADILKLQIPYMSKRLTLYYDT